MEKYAIPNLRNACQVLKTIAQAEAPMRVADLSRELNVPATTALRIARTLELEGFVRKERGFLRLGPSLVYLGSAALSDTEIRRESLAVLQALARDTNETAHVAVPCDGRALIVAVCDSPHPLRAASSAGTMADLHCSSTGKLFLAYLHGDRVGEWVTARAPSRRTPNTLVTARDLQREATLIRQRGYSIDNEEIHLGVRCVAAPVMGPEGEIVAAIGITASAARFTPDKDEHFAKRVRTAASDLSRRLGHI